MVLSGDCATVVLNGKGGLSLMPAPKNKFGLGKGGGASGGGDQAVSGCDGAGHDDDDGDGAAALSSLHSVSVWPCWGWT